MFPYLGKFLHLKLKKNVQNNSKGTNYLFNSCQFAFIQRVSIKDAISVVKVIVEGYEKRELAI